MILAQVVFAVCYGVILGLVLPEEPMIFWPTVIVLAVFGNIVYTKWADSFRDK